jgi:hypothetical protein
VSALPDVFHLYEVVKYALPADAQAWVDGGNMVPTLHRVEAVLGEAQRQLATAARLRAERQEAEAAAQAAARRAAGGPDTIEDVFARILALPDNKYDSIKNDRTIKAFTEAGAKEAMIATGGFKLKLLIYDRTLIAIWPNAKSARPEYGDGRLVIWPYAVAERSRQHRKIGRYTYYFDTWRNTQRLIEAVKLAYQAFERADGDMTTFYKALGAQGMCAICGRGLSDPLSVDRGIGPECIQGAMFESAAQMDAFFKALEAKQAARRATED